MKNNRLPHDNRLFGEYLFTYHYSVYNILNICSRKLSFCQTYYSIIIEFLSNFEVVVGILLLLKLGEWLAVLYSVIYFFIRYVNTPFLKELRDFTRNLKYLNMTHNFQHLILIL